MLALTTNKEGTEEEEKEGEREEEEGKGHHERHNKGSIKEDSGQYVFLNPMILLPGTILCKGRYSLILAFHNNRATLHPGLKHVGSACHCGLMADSSG